MSNGIARAFFIWLAVILALCLPFNILSIVWYSIVMNDNTEKERYHRLLVEWIRQAGIFSMISLFQILFFTVSFGCWIVNKKYNIHVIINIVIVILYAALYVFLIVLISEGAYLIEPLNYICSHDDNSEDNEMCNLFIVFKILFGLMFVYIPVPYIFLIWGMCAIKQSEH